MSIIGVGIPGGRAYDHSSQTIRVFGVPYDGIDEIKYPHGRDGSEFLYGTSKVPIAQTDGIYKPEDGTMKIARAQWNLLRTAIQVKGLALGKGWLEVRFPIIVEREALGQFSFDVIKGARIKKSELSSSKGGGALMQDVTFEFFEVVEDASVAIVTASSLIPAV